MDNRGEIIVAIMNNKRDFQITCEQQWYRIPVNSVDKWLKKRWPPQWLAFYQTKIFGDEAYAVNYYAKITDIRQVSRQELFPGEKNNPKSLKRYYRFGLEPLQKLPKPIFSRRWRRIIFIPTTWEKFINAMEINDLYDESPLEDRLWAEFKRLQIHAERQELVAVDNRNYFLDFTVYCAGGKVNVETDGDTWHANAEKSVADNLRDNSLKTAGWQVLRFNTYHIREEMAGYCVPTIIKNINNLGGVETDGKIYRKIVLEDENEPVQLEIF